jgi:hypothetical protein
MDFEISVLQILQEKTGIQDSSLSIHRFEETYVSGKYYTIFALSLV